jgi:hypothetical protein
VADDRNCCWHFVDCCHLAHDRNCWWHFVDSITKHFSANCLTSRVTDYCLTTALHSGAALFDAVTRAVMRRGRSLGGKGAAEQ